jgi:predicted site-specific integrase-resolvase
MQNGGLPNIEWLAAKQAAQMLGVSIWTLKDWRKPKKIYGPPFYRQNGRVRYARSDIENWLDKIRVDPAA